MLMSEWSPIREVAANWPWTWYAASPASNGPGLGHAVWRARPRARSCSALLLPNALVQTTGRLAQMIEAVRDLPRAEHHPRSKRCRPNARTLNGVVGVGERKGKLSELTEHWVEKPSRETASNLYHHRPRHPAAADFRRARAREARRRRRRDRDYRRHDRARPELQLFIGLGIEGRLRLRLEEGLPEPPTSPMRLIVSLRRRGRSCCAARRGLAGGPQPPVVNPETTWASSSGCGCRLRRSPRHPDARPSKAHWQCRSRDTEQATRTRRRATLSASAAMLEAEAKRHYYVFAAIHDGLGPRLHRRGIPSAARGGSS